jgi:hypothetical protein
LAERPRDAAPVRAHEFSALGHPARRGVAPPRRVLVAEDGRAEATEPRLSVPCL